MPEAKAFLNRVHVGNILSLRDVSVPLKPLTVLVGPNASGEIEHPECSGTFPVYDSG